MGTMGLSEQGKVVAYTDHLDECHRISDSIINRIREAVDVLKAQAAIWEPEPCPDRREFP